jgi:hypothetical protein
MKDTLKSPCNACPFRKNSAPGWLGPWETLDLHHFVMGEGNFACHLTIPKNEVNEAHLDEVTTRCAGSVLYLGKNCKSPRHEPLASILKKAKADPEYPARLENILNLREFQRHHNNNINDNDED